jgi:hypothetical protein
VILQKGLQTILQFERDLYLLIPQLLHDLGAGSIGLQEVQAGWAGGEVFIQFLVIMGVQPPFNIVVKKIHTLSTIKEVAHGFPSK